MVMIIVSIATNMIKNGFVGGFLNVQDNSSELHIHCEAPDCTVDGASRQET